MMYHESRAARHASQALLRRMLLMTLLILPAIATLNACTSSQERALNAQSRVADKRVDLVQKYEKCMKKAKGDEQKQQECEFHLKAANALD